MKKIKTWNYYHPSNSKLLDNKINATATFKSNGFHSYLTLMY